MHFQTSTRCAGYFVLIFDPDWPVDPGGKRVEKEIFEQYVIINSAQGTQLLLGEAEVLSGFL